MKAQPQNTPQEPTCACGAPARWRDDRNGRREFLCDACAAGYPSPRPKQGAQILCSFEEWKPESPDAVLVCPPNGAVTVRVVSSSACTDTGSAPESELVASLRAAIANRNNVIKLMDARIISLLEDREDKDREIETLKEQVAALGKKRRS